MVQTEATFLFKLLRALVTRALRSPNQFPLGSWMPLKTANKQRKETGIF